MSKVSEIHCMKLVGKVKEAHGLKGEFYILVFSGDVSWLPRLKSCGIKLKSQAEPQSFAVEKVKPFKDGFILKTAEVKDRTAAEPFKGAEFHIDEELFVSKKGETIYLSEILNFKVKDKDQTDIGQIVAFSSNGVQDLLVVKKANGKDIEIPFVEAFIKKIDWKHNTLVMDLPEGLTDLEKI
jgi:16S rRNA processing protein RimM